MIQQNELELGEPSCVRPPPNMATFPTVVAAKKERATLSTAVDHTLVALLYISMIFEYRAKRNT
jgi:hypothetical protein